MGRLSVAMILLASIARAELPPQAFGDMLIAATTWTPYATGANPALWLDASDYSTLFADTNATTQATNLGYVARWKDKSTNRLDMSQTTSTSRPTIIDNVVVFGLSGTTNWLSGVRPFSTTGNFTIVSVAETFTDTIYANDSFYLGSISYADQGVLYGNKSTRTFYIHGSGSEFSVLGTRATNLAITVGARFSTNIYAAVNGESPKRATGFVGALRTGTASPSAAGRGRVRELIVYGSYDTNIVAKTEGYLAYKWGITALLPTNHPYRYISPRLYQ